ncbi:DinB family protein [Allokutzneria sp. A3M-2-11 16]|uniref:DinB family protein n=1 Tax=Allokutzneria sp. A3M-2-11 16 TaxID=2962043 RepID=UPI0020B639B7|nr:DinB family protein [Allokutzneria sp. A3M-2-11 16]MCP3804253.1 DinB family protein [Allokutzneria sp. A3M-2-11 16]
MTTFESTELTRTLAELRAGVRVTVRDLTDADVAKRTTVSELTLGGIIKHLTQGERAWTHIMCARPGVPDRMFDTGQYYLDGESLASLLADYEAAAAETDAAVAALLDLSATVPLPESPWDPGLHYWSARRILLHLIKETAQHAGHADLIRESLDGAQSTGA